MNWGLSLRLLLDISAHQHWEMPQLMSCVKTDSLKTSIVKYTLGHLYVVTRPGINIVFHVVQGNNAFFCECIYNGAMKIFCKKGGQASKGGSGVNAELGPTQDQMFTLTGLNGFHLFYFAKQKELNLTPYRCFSHDAGRCDSLGRTFL